ncbi:MAG: hypothetical protein O2787_09385 [Cyanobacteria bacterium]|nr:hypothetical protein [Cyanobacteriota bacterium]
MQLPYPEDAPGSLVDQALQLAETDHFDAGVVIGLRRLYDKAESEEDQRTIGQMIESQIVLAETAEDMILIDEYWGDSQDLDEYWGDDEYPDGPQQS